MNTRMEEMDMEEKHFPGSLRARDLEVGDDIARMEGYLFTGRNDAQVVFWECGTALEVKPHVHEYDEYCLVVEGECHEFIEGVEHVLRKGDEILIPAGKRHWARMVAPYRAIDFFGGARFQYRGDRT
jgi:quercetin dioxygenase-like cupin family protein